MSGVEQSHFDWGQMDWGHKVPLFSKEDLKAVSEHLLKEKGEKKRNRRRRKFKRESSVLNPEGWIPSINDPYNRRCLISQEMREKRTHLRNLINLPIARGNDPHVKDKFYEHLVRTIVKFDTFGIFTEFDRVMILSSIPPELEERIQEVRGIIDEVLQPDLSKNQRYERFRQSRKEFQDRHEQDKREKNW